MTNYTVSSATSGILLSGYDDTLTVIGGGNASGTLATGQQAAITVSSGGSVVGSLLSGPLETLVVSSGGAASLTTLAIGGDTVTVSSGGIAVTTTLTNGDYVVVDGQTTGTVVSSGNEIVSSGGSTTGTNVLGGTQAVDSSGLAVSTMLSGSSQQYILQGGIASNGVLIGQAQEYVSSGGLSEDASILGSAQITVFSGGQTTGTVVQGGGQEFLQNGASATLTSVGTSGVETVSSGATAIGTAIGFNGYVVVSQGGVMSGTTVSSGGLEVVLSGATVDQATIEAGGAIIVLPGANATYAAVAPGALVVSTGIADVISGILVADEPFVSGLYALQNAAEYVFSGGTSISAAFGVPADFPGPRAARIAPVQTVYSGGVASNTRLDANARQVVLSGGVTMSTYLAGGLSMESVSSGGTAVASEVGFGASLLLSSGAVASGTLLNAGATLVVPSGASVTTTVISGGELYVLSAGVISNTSGFGGYLYVEGGEADGGVLAGGFANQTGQGVLSGTILTDGQVDDVLGGMTVGTVLDSASEVLFAGYDSVAQTTTVNSGGLLDILNTGSAMGTLVDSGGYLMVESGGMAVATTVMSGGALIELPGAIVSGTVIEPGGAVLTPTVYRLNSASLYDYATSGTASNLTVGVSELAVILSGGEADGTVNDGGQVHVFLGGRVSATNLVSGSVTIASGGVAIDTAIGSGAEFFNEGIASYTQVESGIFYDDGAADHTIVSSGGVAAVNGTAVGTTVSSGGDLDVGGLNNSASATGTTLLSGASETVEGTETSAVVAGGIQTVSNGGLAVATTLAPGGNQGGAVGGLLVVGPQGQTSGTLIGSLGQEQVLSGGSASGTVVSSGGLEIVEEGGTATDTDVQSGGFLVAFPSATVTAPTIEPGGMVVSTGVILSANGAISITAGSGDVLSAGYVEDVLPGAIASGTTISSGGTLALDGGSATATAVLPGGMIDLSTIPYDPNNFVTFNSGTDVLTLTNGSQVIFQDTLAGTYSSSTFAPVMDGSGQTSVEIFSPTLAAVSSGPLTTVASFSGADGIEPIGGVIADANGNLFGVTVMGGVAGGTNDQGVLVELAKTTSGYAAAPIVLASFTGTDGAYPVGSLVMDANGDVFGTTVEGGTDNDGTVFELANTTSGYAAAPTTLVSFDGADGAYPGTSLIVDANGNLFGTTTGGGPSNDGRVFEIANTANGYAGTPTVLAAAGGVIEPLGSLIEDANGDLFGTTIGDGGYTSYGDVYEIAETASGYASAATVLAEFDVTDGAGPLGDLVADASGNLFGVTRAGGASGEGTVFEIVKSAAGYASTPAVLASFPSTDGSPTGGLIIDAAGNLFGTAEGGGPSGYGTDFEITHTSGGYAATPTVLVDFNYENGANPSASLIADADGNLFGTTVGGLGSFIASSYNDGSIYELTDTGYQVACYCRGTLILTDQGEVTVETLAAGDIVVTASGEHRPARWIGRRGYARPFLVGNPNVQPIRFRAGSLGGGLPRRDLLVSPEHAMLLDGVLVAAKLLLNGETIVQELDLATVEYFHVELDSHDVLLAEGAPSESFVDCDSRGMFHNAHTFTGEAPRWSFCAPRIEDGPALAHIRARLRPAGPAIRSAVQGHLDWATHERCAGWAWLPEDPAATLEVEVLVDGAVIARVTANELRSDVKAHGMGTGRYGFTLDFAQPLPRFRMQVVTARAVGGDDLVGTAPLGAAAALDLACLPSLAASLQAHAATVHGARELTTFLQEQLQATRTIRHRHGAGPLALVLDDSAPRLGHDAGSAAITSHMQALVRLGYQVVFVPLDGRSGALPQGVVCAAWPDYPSVEDALRQHRDAALVYVHRIAGMALYGSLIRSTCPGARLVYSVADLHFVRIGRQASVERSATRMGESRRLRELEVAAARLADMTLTHSPAEAELLRRLVPGGAVGVVPWHVSPGLAPYAWRRRSGLLFVGGTAHAPNADALRWLASAIMPRVVELNPRIRCRVVGAGLTEADRSWLHPAMEVMGSVPNLSRAYRSARVAVAPLRFGAGVSGKVLEGFAAGLPCVMTPIAAEGLALSEAMLPLVAEDADAFAQLVVTLHGDQASNLAAGQAGRAMVLETTSEAAMDAALANAVASAGAPRMRPRVAAAP